MNKYWIKIKKSKKSTETYSSRMEMYNELWIDTKNKDINFSLKWWSIT